MNSMHRSHWPRRFLLWLLVAATGLALAACGGGGGGVAAAVAPTITSQPAAQTVDDGASVTFSVGADGTAPLAYQWQRNGTDIAGATSASYSLAAAALADSGARFTVRVSNAAGSITSAEAVLTVNGVAPAITQQPADRAVLVGADAAFSIAAGGSSPLTYQWRRGGAPIANANASSYTLASAQLGDSGATFDVVVSNAFGSTTSAAATLTVSAAPPPAVALCYAAGATNSCYASPFAPAVADVHLADAINGLALTRFSVLRTSNGGVSWTLAAQLNDPMFAVGFNRFAFGSASVGVAVGGSSMIRTTDGGQSWSAVTLPAGVSQLAGVRFFGANTAFAFGSNLILRSTDAGATWNAVSTASGSWGGLAFDAAGQLGVAVGGTFVARSTDGGATWTTASATPSGFDVDYGSDAFVAVGDGTSTIRRSTDGITWTVVASGTTSSLHSVRFAGVDGLIAGGTGTILRSTDGGRTWAAVTSGTTEQLALIRRAGTNEVAAVTGVSGQVRRSSDGGQTWTGPPAPATLSPGLAVAHNGAIPGIALGSGGVRSTDGGASWSALNLGGSFSGVFAFASSDVAVAVGKLQSANTILRSTDGGLTWAAASGVPSSASLADVHFGSPSNGIAVGQHIKPGDPIHGQTALLRTTDGGANWTAVPIGLGLQAIQNVRFASTNVALAYLNNGAILRSTDAGATWTQVLKTPGPPAGGSSSAIIRFANAGVGSIWTFAPFGYWRTSDGGATWTEVLPGPGNFSRLDLLYGTNRGFAILDDQYATTDDAGATFTKLGLVPRQVLSDALGGAVMSSPTTVIGSRVLVTLP
jgi:photosystem II stability/assembly factor-like uncharacterized protein